MLAVHFTVNLRRLTSCSLLIKTALKCMGIITEHVIIVMAGALLLRPRSSNIDDFRTSVFSEV